MLLCMFTGVFLVKLVKKTWRNMEQKHGPARWTVGRDHACMRFWCSAPRRWSGFRWPGTQRGQWLKPCWLVILWGDTIRIYSIQSFYVQVSQFQEVCEISKPTSIFRENKGLSTAMSHIQGMSACLWIHPTGRGQIGKGPIEILLGCSSQLLSGLPHHSYCLVVSNIWIIFHSIWDVILPIDFHIFQDG